MDGFDQDTLISLVVFLALDLFGLCVLVAGLVTLALAKFRSDRQHRADGTVVAHERYLSHRMSGDSSMPITMLKPRLRFIVEGREYSFLSRLGTNMPPAVGSVVPVAYDPYNPDRAELDTLLARYLVPTVLTATGLLMLMVFTGVGWAVVFG